MLHLATHRAVRRKRREIDPTLHVLQECVADLKSAGTDNAYTRERLEDMLQFLTTTSGCFEELVRMPPAALKGLARLRGKFAALLGMGKKSSPK